MRNQTTWVIERYWTWALLTVFYGPALACTLNSIFVLVWGREQREILRSISRARLNRLRIQIESAHSSTTSAHSNSSSSSRTPKSMIAARVGWYPGEKIMFPGLRSVWTTPRATNSSTASRSGCGSDKGTTFGLTSASDSASGRNSRKRTWGEMARSESCNEPVP